MLNSSFVSQAVVSNNTVQSYTVGKPSGSSCDEIQVTVIGDHVSYTGGYGSAVLSMSGSKNMLDVIGDHSSNDYLLSKVIACNFTGNDTREALMCDTLRHLAANR